MSSTNTQKKLKNFLSQIFLYKETDKYDFSLPTTSTEATEDSEEIDDSSKVKKVYSKLTDNLEYMKVQYNALINSDIIIRNFTLTARNKEYAAFLIYFDGMVNSTIINDFVMKPLMLRNTANTYDEQNFKPLPNNPYVKVRKAEKFDLENCIYNKLLPQNDVKKKDDFEALITDINSGNCIMFVDTISTAFSLETKGFKARSIGEPNNEIVVHGSQEAFVEVIRTNTSIIRRLANTEDLVIESTSVGKISKTQIAICYLKNIANADLVSEVKFRVNNLAIDSLLSSGQLEQLIQDDNSSFPQVLSTERPDKAVNHLFEGRVVIIVNGSPYALIVPGVLIDFISSPEDLNLKYQYANVLRIVRLIAAFFALLLPGLYIAITCYHQELIPTPLLFEIASSRESVPFPVIFEIIIMEVSFELIREAGLRVPSPIGPTIRNCWCANFRRSCS